ncbi:MAG: hypothetical protein FWG56_00490 [Desulfovibrionaceae bacterium]|nr:hypothetical protein [Desulfovibrionaceae bacterium]
MATGNGQHIRDVRRLPIDDPLPFESSVNQWPGVVTAGVFAHPKATVCLLGTLDGVSALSLKTAVGRLFTLVTSYEHRGF